MRDISLRRTWETFLVAILVGESLLALASTPTVRGLAPTMTLVSCSPSSVPVNTPTVCVATVLDTSGTPVTPTGTVSFTTSPPGAVVVATCTIAAVNVAIANCTTTFVASAAGSYTIIACYSGDSLHHPSCSSGFNVTVGNTTLPTPTLTTIVSLGGASLWHSTTAYPKAAYNHQCVGYSGYIYCIGGLSTGGGLADVYSAPLSASGVGAWTSLPAYPGFSYFASCVTDSGYVYCIGGYLNNAPSSSVFFAHLLPLGGIGPWTATTSYPTTIASNSCVVYSGYVYCVGGAIGLGTAIISQVYSAQLSSTGLGPWSLSGALPSYPTPIEIPSCAVDSGYVYCVGGQVSISSPPFTNLAYSAQLLSSGGLAAWSSTTSYPSSTILAQRCVSGSGTIYCIGGYDPNTGDSSALYSAPVASPGQLGSWSLVTAFPGTEIPDTMILRPCVVFGGFVYCVGGTTFAVGAVNRVDFAALLTTDQAVLSRTNGPPSPTSTVTYYFYANTNCAGIGTPEGSFPANSIGPSMSVTATSGASFNAVFSGDANNAPAISTCEPLPVVTASVLSLVPGCGNVSFSINAGQLTRLVAVNTAGLPANPLGQSFPCGLFSFTITGLSLGQTVDIMIIAPITLPINTQYVKYQPRASPSGWFTVSTTQFGSHVIAFSVTDGGTGDSDGLDGVITDLGGIGIQPVVTCDDLDQNDQSQANEIEDCND